MSDLYDRILKRKLETFKEDVMSDLNAMALSPNLQFPSEATRLVVLLDQLKTRLSKVEQYNIQPLAINIKDMIEDKYRDDIFRYKELCKSLRQQEKAKIAKLNKEKDDIVKASRKDLKDLIAENYNQLNPYIDKHNSLKAKRKELEDIFRLYCIRCNGFELDRDVSLEELDELFDLAKYGVEGVLRDKKWTNQICELLYLPTVLEVKDELTRNIFSIVYFISLVLVCVFAKPILALLSVIYLINTVSNVTFVLQRKELLQMAYLMSEPIEFEKYIEDTPEIVEVRDNLQDAIAYDLSPKIEAISKEFKEKIDKIEDPAEEMESELRKATVAMSDGVVTAEIQKVCKECYTAKEDIIAVYQEKIEKLQEVLERIPKDMLGDDILNSDLLSTKMRIGSVNANDKPISEISIDIPYKSIGFVYTDDNKRKEVLKYMKLVLANYISNVNPKQLSVDIYDQHGFGSEFSEFLGGDALNYVKIVRQDFNKLFTEIQEYVETNITSFGVDDIQRYNSEAIAVEKTTIKYRMLVLVSGVALEQDDTLKNFIIEKTKQGFICLFLYKDSTCFKDEAKAKLEDLYSKILVCRKYGELIDSDRTSYGSVGNPGIPYIYSNDIGRKVMDTYNVLLEKRKDPALKYKERYQEKQIPRDKFWTYNTLYGIEARFGYVDGDPTKAEHMMFGDDTPHCLTVGKTGAGKSVFINNALANMVLMYPPEWLTLCMIDFKNTEFFIFQGEGAIPHAKLVAGTTDGEYAVSVFTFIDQEMARRNAHFLSYGTKNIIEYNEAVLRGQIKDKPMPRMLFLIDEFQVMFNKVAPKSLMKIEQSITSLSKVARSAGCHLWFTSQSMKGTMSEDILNQFELRVALSCDEGLSNAILGNPAAAKIDRKGYSYSNHTGGKMATANKYWRTPWIETHVFLDYIKELNEKCDREGRLRRVYKVFDEKEKFPHTELEKWLENPKVKGDPDLFVLGEPTFFAANVFPPTLSLFKDNSENILFGTYDIEALVNGINTFIWNIKSKENTEIIIHSVDKDVATLLGAEEKISPQYKVFLNNDIMNLNNIIDVMDTTLQSRIDNPDKEYKRLFFIGIGWDKMDGLGESMSYSIEGKLKKLFDKAPKYGIHFIIANKDISEFKTFKKNFLHRIGSKLDSKSGSVIEDNDKLSSKEFMSHVAIYSTDAEEVKFKLYQFPVAGKLRTRGLKVENFD